MGVGKVSDRTGPAHPPNPKAATVSIPIAIRLSFM
jgi:hypothetical protein